MNSFQLYMFDFDGVLVDTEKAHYEAYRRMCEGKGVALSWDFPAYCLHAHYSNEGIRIGLQKDHPELFEQEPDWNILYAEKSRAILDVYEEGAIQLMPGVEKLLQELDEQKIMRCVVTHSSEQLVSMLRNQHPQLNTIPHWITREDYSKPKPDPECYQTAMHRLLPLGGKAIGFEDSIRGVRALMDSGAEACLVTTMLYPEIPGLVQQGMRHIPTLKQLEL